jgi:hypothetical protein
LWCARFARGKQVPRCARNGRKKGKSNGKGKYNGKGKGTCNDNSKCGDSSLRSE